MPIGGGLARLTRQNHLRHVMQHHEKCRRLMREAGVPMSACIINGRAEPRRSGDAVIGVAAKAKAARPHARIEAAKQPSLRMSRI